MKKKYPDFEVVGDCKLSTGAILTVFHEESLKNEGASIMVEDVSKEDCLYVLNIPSENIPWVILLLQEVYDRSKETHNHENVHGQ